MNATSVVPLSHCSATLYHALHASGLTEGQVNLAQCLLKLVQKPQSDVSLALYEAGEVSPEWAAHLLVWQDGDTPPVIDSVALLAALDDHARRRQPHPHLRSATLLEALLSLPGLRAHMVGLLPRLSSWPSVRLQLLLNEVMARSVENSTLERFELDDPHYQHDYLLTTPLAILAILHDARRAHSVLTLHGDACASIPAYVDAIRPDASDGNNTLWLAIHAEASKVRALLATRRIVVETWVNKVKVQFALHDIRQAGQDGQVRLHAPVPAQLLRLQRREHFRLSPKSHPAATCQLALHDARGRPIHQQVAIDDLSSGGLGFSLPPHIGLPPGITLSDCLLVLPGEQSHTINLCLRNCNTQATQVHYGCEFVDPPLALVAALDRYIMQQNAMLTTPA